MTDFKLPDHRTDVGPHEFEPLRRFFNRGRCRACYWPDAEHPITGWVSMRPRPEPVMWRLYRLLGIGGFSRA